MNVQPSDCREAAELIREVSDIDPLGNYTGSSLNVRYHLPEWSDKKAVLLSVSVFRPVQQEYSRSGSLEKRNGRVYKRVDKAYLSGRKDICEKGAVCTALCQQNPDEGRHNAGALAEKGRAV